MTVTDADGDAISEMTSVVVRNSAPGVLFLAPQGIVGDDGHAQLLVEFSDPGTVDEHTVTINWGAFVNTIINFLIIAFALFLVIRAMNAAKAEEEAPSEPPPPPEDVVLLREIRDSLRR